ncbi:MAG: hypothetical protein ACTTKL_11200 [Treponema sp.]
MSVSKKALRINRKKMGITLKKSGFALRRFVFNGIENTTGLERKFFIELAAVNPSLSPSEAVLGFKARAKISEEDLQNVLAGTSAAYSLESEAIVAPSYVAVRAGVFGDGAKQVCAYFPYDEVKESSRTFEAEAGACHFSEQKLSGQIECAASYVNAHPELLCSAGFIKWDLQYELRSDFTDGFKGGACSWYATGARTVFAGSVTVDGREYNVSPQKSLGYIDRSWGKTMQDDYLHLSSSNLTSLITGKTLQESCCVLQGVYGGRVSLLLNFENETFKFTADSAKRAYSSLWECTQMPADEDGEKLHWSVSLTNKKYVIDVDVYCPASQLFVRSLELPEGGRTVLKVLCGGNGTGEIRLYKKVKKNIEIIEHAHIANALCEFGKREVPEL